jgi:hypothetical protein
MELSQEVGLIRPVAASFVAEIIGEEWMQLLGAVH